MWTFEIYSNGSRVKVKTGLADFGDAQDYIEGLYGDDITIVSQDFVASEEGNKGLFGGLFS